MDNESIIRRIDETLEKSGTKPEAFDELDYWSKQLEIANTAVNVALDRLAKIHEKLGSLGLDQ